MPEDVLNIDSIVKRVTLREEEKPIQDLLILPAKGVEALKGEKFETVQVAVEIDAKVVKRQMCDEETKTWGLVL